MEEITAKLLTRDEVEEKYKEFLANEEQEKDISSLNVHNIQMNHYIEKINDKIMDARIEQTFQCGVSIRNTKIADEITTRLQKLGYNVVNTRFFDDTKSVKHRLLISWK